MAPKITTLVGEWTNGEDGNWSAEKKSMPLSEHLGFVVVFAMAER
jgi:hypothetical protein